MSVNLLEGCERGRKGHTDPILTSLSKLGISGDETDTH